MTTSCDARIRSTSSSAPERIVYTATVVASDPKSDVALLKLNARPGEKFKAIQLAREDDLLLGETVLALGNPFGLGGSVSRGILSSKSRIAAEGRRAAGYSRTGCRPTRPSTSATAAGRWSTCAVS